MDEKEVKAKLQKMRMIGEFVCSCPGERHAVVLSRLSKKQLEEKLEHLDQVQAEQSIFPAEKYQRLRTDYVAEIAKYS